jgi:DNA-binding NarL/FixJ family response regulator
VTRVVVADDQALVRSGFAMMLAAHDDLEVVGEAKDGREAVALARSTRPDVVLMDIQMPVLDGISATQAILREPDPPRVLVLTTFDVDEYVVEALRAGASGFLLKDAGREQLVSAVEIVARGESLLAPSVTRRLIERFVRSSPTPPPRELEELTPREREVLELMARERSNAELASDLVISETTAKTHVARVLTKLGLRDRVQAVVFAYEHGIVQPGRVDIALRGRSKDHNTPNHQECG